jgi:hypothetical protein
MFIDELTTNVQIPLSLFVEKTKISRSKVIKILQELTQGENSIGKYLPLEAIFIKKSVDLKASEEAFTSYLKDMDLKKRQRNRKTDFKSSSINKNQIESIEEKRAKMFARLISTFTGELALSDISKMLEFNDINEFKKWLLNNSFSGYTIEGDYFILESKQDLTKMIDNLVKSFDSKEKL